MAREGNGSAAWKGLVISIISRNNYSVFISSAAERALFNGVLKDMVEGSRHIKKRTSAWFYGEV